MEHILLSALLIFMLRIVDVSLYMMRFMMVMRGRKVYAWIFAFCQSIIYISVIANVIKNITEPLILLGYAAGLATGMVVGMWIESRLAIGYTHLRIVSSGLGADLVAQLRDEGYAATEIAGRGQSGMVSILSLNVYRRKTRSVIDKVSEIDPEAFVTAENVRSVDGGFWGR
jgi:uncharacterized protein YebE (UPF0316 family)